MARNKTNPVSILTEARDLIAKGWTQNVAYRKVFGRDCYCSVGALGMVERGDADLNAPIGGAYLNSVLDYRSIVTFNDDPKTKKADVLDLFDKAIEKAKAERALARRLKAA